MSTNESKEDEQVKVETPSNDFHIQRGKAEHLTEFQREKAKYFFRVNLDIENKEHITWNDVDFYIQFHITAAGKDGLSGGDIEPRLERATRALWEFIHQEIPLPDENRDQLTLDQALDTWASLIDYINENHRLPVIIEDFIKLGFELYSTDDQTSIQPIAFDQLFHHMELGRPYAIMAYKILTESGTVPLTYDKIENLVREVITSSNDEHPSHFLLPGFFKTITNKEKPSSPITNEKKSSAVSTPKISSTPERQKSPSPSPPSSPVPTKKEENTHLPTPPRIVSPKLTPTEPIVAPPSPPPAPNSAATLRDEDESIRQLLRFYHIDDGDIVEVAAGSVQRVVLVHPERPLPAYIQQNKELLQKIYSNNPSAPVPQPRTTLDERNIRPNLQQRREQPKREVPRAAEEKIVSNVLKELAPFIEKRVSEELHRLQNNSKKTGLNRGAGEENKNNGNGHQDNNNNNDDDDDDDDDDDAGGFIPFPFMFARPPAANGSSPPGAAAFLPPPLLMAMMNDLARSAAAGPPPSGPAGPMGGVEGFMMFVNGEPMMPDGPRF